MQKRHTDRLQYFYELAYTSEHFLMPYLCRFTDLCKPKAILEIGCGDGGNLLPFARLGHDVTGVDISVDRIRDAISFFEKENVVARFICRDVFCLDEFDSCFDLIICHDVIEHITRKQELLFNIKRLMKPDGILFIAFPAWQMPFGGHQQICHNRMLSHIPFIHLLPTPLYKRLLTHSGESADCIKELISIKSTKTTIESFEGLIPQSGLCIIDRLLFLINPHYKAKFGLRPRILPAPFSRIPYLRNFFTTGCFYILKHNK